MALKLNIRSYGVITLAGPTTGVSAGGTKAIETKSILAVGITR